jgi:hypothetical protein
MAEQARRFNAANPDLALARRRRTYDRLGGAYGHTLKYVHGISMQEYRRMVVRQGGKCVLCGTSAGDLVLDHCHDTDIVRGLLCYSCNSGLGMFRDDPEALRRAASYIERNMAKAMMVA